MAEEDEELASFKLSVTVTGAWVDVESRVALTFVPEISDPARLVTEDEEAVPETVAAEEAVL